MTGPLGAYSYDDAREIHRRVLGSRQSHAVLDNTRDKTIHNLLYYVLLTEDLAAATNETTGYTQAQGRIIRYVQPTSATSLNMESSTSAQGLITVTNRYTTFSAGMDDLILVIRNGAEWSPVTSGGAGRITSVRFKIVSSDPTTLSGLAQIIAWDYGFAKTQIPATIAGNTVIEICDPMGCFLNEPNVDLTDRAGVAVYRDSDVIDNCRTGYAPFDGVWEVTSLCCKLLSCDVVI